MSRRSWLRAAIHAATAMTVVMSVACGQKDSPPAVGTAAERSPYGLEAAHLPNTPEEILVTFSRMPQTLDGREKRYREGDAEVVYGADGKPDVGVGAITPERAFGDPELSFGEWLESAVSGGRWDPLEASSTASTDQRVLFAVGKNSGDYEAVFAESEGEYYFTVVGDNASSRDELVQIFLQATGASGSKS